jgi:hypothetical protein
LFDPTLPVLQEKIVNPGEQAYLYDLSRVEDKSKPQVLCAASRVYNEKIESGKYSFLTKSPSKTHNVMRILLPSKPVATAVTDAKGNALSGVTGDWNDYTHTFLLQFENESDGIKVTINF